MKRPEKGLQKIQIKSYPLFLTFHTWAAQQECTLPVFSMQQITQLSVLYSECQEIGRSILWRLIVLTHEKRKFFSISL